MSRRGKSATTESMNSLHLAASVLAADMGYLGDEITALTAANIDIFHWDIMDGHFVPNISFGPMVMKALRPLSDKIFDVHLMVSNPIQWIDSTADAGADYISFHIEAVADPMIVIKKIKDHHVKAGIAINPDTTIDTIPDAVFAEIERVIIMTVNPGFGGQKFIDQTMKIKALRARFPDLDIMIDGGVNLETAPLVIEAGATTLVTGSALFNADDKQEFIAAIRGMAI